METRSWVINQRCLLWLPNRFEFGLEAATILWWQSVTSAIDDERNLPQFTLAEYSSVHRPTRRECRSRRLLTWTVHRTHKDADSGATLLVKSVLVHADRFDALGKPGGYRKQIGEKIWRRNATSRNFGSGYLIVGLNRFKDFATLTTLKRRQNAVWRKV